MLKLKVAIATAQLLGAGCASSGQYFPGLKSTAQDWNVKTVESKWRAGPDIREAADGTNNNRWTNQTGLEATTYNGHKLGLEYRRRDTDNGVGANDGHDDSVWVTWSIPIWADTSRPSKEEALERRIAELEKRLLK